MNRMNVFTPPFVIGVLMFLTAAVWYGASSSDDTEKIAGLALLGVGIMVYGAFFQKPPPRRSGKTSRHWYDD